MPAIAVVIRSVIPIEPAPEPGKKKAPRKPISAQPAIQQKRAALPRYTKRQGQHPKHMLAKNKAATKAAKRRIKTSRNPNLLRSI